MHRALNPMYFENAGHMGGVTEDDIQRISMTLPKFPVYFGGCHPQIPAQMSGFGFQGTVYARHAPLHAPRSGKVAAG